MTRANSRSRPLSIHAMRIPRAPFAARRMRGFTLIEMIAAFLVFAIAIGLLLDVLGSSMRNARLSADYTMAALWAQTKLDGVGVVERVEEGHSSGRFDDRFSWDLDVHKVDASEVEPPPQQLVDAQGSPRGMPQGMPQGVSAANAGLGGGIEAQPPFDLYQVDLVVSWPSGGGRPPRTAHFGTLRAVNPDQEQQVRAEAGAMLQPGGLGGGKR